MEKHAETIFMERFCELIKKGNVRQSELSDAIDRSRQSIHQYMTGRSVPTYDVLVKISNYFGVSIDYLLGKTDKFEGFAEGMQVAWEMSRRITSSKLNGGIDGITLMNLFGVESITSIFKEYSAKEAKKIIDEYDAEKIIHEGDVVEILEQKAVVLVIDRDIASVYVIDNDDGKVQEVPLHQLKKEGHCVDVRSSLKSAYETAKAFHVTRNVMVEMSKEAERASQKFMEINLEAFKEIAKGSAD